MQPKRKVNALAIHSKRYKLVRVVLPDFNGECTLSWGYDFPTVLQLLKESIQGLKENHDVRQCSFSYLFDIIINLRISSDFLNKKTDLKIVYYLHLHLHFLTLTRMLE